MDSVQYILSPREAYIAEQQWRVVKRSVDARQRELRVHLTILTDDKGKPVPKDAPIPLYEPPVFQDVHNAERSVVIIGAGPAGLFCGYMLALKGLKPLIIERGADVDKRTEIVEHFWKTGELDTSTNVQFEWV